MLTFFFRLECILRLCDVTCAHVRMNIVYVICHICISSVRINCGQKFQEWRSGEIFYTNEQYLIKMCIFSSGITSGEN